MKGRKFKVQGKKNQKIDDLIEKRIVGMPYVRKDFFLSEAERSFYFSLHHVASHKYEVFTKIRIADLIDVPEDVVLHDEYLFKITHKHIDFLLCRKSDIYPLLAIELDDSSHYIHERYERDIFVDAVFKRAGIPLLHLPVKRDYISSELEIDINNALGIKEKPF